MTFDITTSLTAMLDRLVDDIVDEIAKEGLALLKKILDEAGFQKSPYLKDYEVYAHVMGDVIIFEILLDVDSVVPEDELTRNAIKEAAAAAQAAEADADKTYAIGPNGPQRLVGKHNARRDARTPARDVRRPARDARRTSRDRLILKEVANISPRSAKVDRDGRLSVALKRTAKVVDEEVVMPQNEFQGIIGKFIGEISSLVSGKFAPGLASIIGGSNV